MNGAVVVLRQPAGRERAAGDAHQQQAAHVVAEADVEPHRGAGAGRRAADERGQRAELLQQLMQVVEPERFLGDVALDQHVGAAGVAAVVQHDAIAGVGELGGERHELVVAAPAAGDQRHPRAAIADDLVEDVHSADFGDRHGVSPLSVGAAHAARLPPS